MLTARTIMQANPNDDEASMAAQRYGMPALPNCPKAQGAPQPNTVAQPARLAVGE